MSVTIDPEAAGPPPQPPEPAETAASKRRVSPRRLLVRRFKQSRAGVVGLVIIVGLTLVAGLSGWIAPGNPLALDSPPLRAPSGSYPFGTDNLGRNLYIAVVQGTRTSLIVVFWTLLISTLIGLPVGILIGYRKGFVSGALYRLTELIQVFPRFYLALLVIGLFGASLRNLVLVLALTSWTGLARVVRAETLALKEREFVGAARAYGAPDRRILRRHLFPHVLPASVVLLSLTASRVILIEAGLSFLGLGDQHRVSWGFLASNASNFLQQAWWMSVFPGMAIAIAVIGFNLFGDGLADTLRPASIGRRPRRAGIRRSRQGGTPVPLVAVSLADAKPEQEPHGVPSPVTTDPIITT